jgi:predicted nucleic acid-binding protein
MTADFFIDTNVLLYAQSKHPDESEKRDLAREALRRPGIAFSSQVLGEFYVNVTRKISPPISHDSAVQILRKLETFPILPIGPGEVFRALEIRKLYSISYWDALVVAAAQTLKCCVILSEDLNNGQDYGGVEVINPFR